MIRRLLRAELSGEGPSVEERRIWLARLGTFHFVCLGWVFFRAESIGRAVEVLERIRGPSA